MKLKKIAYFLTFISLPLYASDYQARIPFKDTHFISNNEEKWLSYTPQYSDWVYVGNYYNCLENTPDPKDYNINENFVQTHSGCYRDKSRIVQNRIQNSKTGEIKNTGEPIPENVTDNQLSYSETIQGTNGGYTIFFGAGSATYSGNIVVGMYARTSYSIDIGNKTYNTDNNRVLVYYNQDYANSSVCYLRFAITGKNGWNPGEPAPAKALSFLSQYNYLTTYDKNNNNLGKVALGRATASDAGYFKHATIPCSIVTKFYSDLTYVKKAVLSAQ